MNEWPETPIAHVFSRGTCVGMWREGIRTVRELILAIEKEQASPFGFHLRNVGSKRTGEIVAYLRSIGYNEPIYMNRHIYKPEAAE